MKTVYATPQHRAAPPLPNRCLWENPPQAAESGTILPRKSELMCSDPPQTLPIRHFPKGLADALLAALPPLPAGVFLEEIRLHADRYATLTAGGVNHPTRVLLSGREIYALLVRLCGGSLYAYSDTIREGYMTLAGGVRIGIAGRAICEGARILGVSEIDSLCIRLPHRHGRVGGPVCRFLRHMKGAGEGVRGVLIYAPPGVGKTTLLRGVAATMASPPDPWRTVIIDTRGELGFESDGADLCLDILHGYPRARGVEIATRTLSAELMICDEIGDVEEAMALVSAHHGGVPLVASAHAAMVDELLRCPGIRLLHEARIFGAYVGISRRPRGADYIYRITPWEDAERLLGGMLSC